MRQIDYRVLYFCATECKRQKSGEMSVLHMAEAVSFALDCGALGLSMIISLGQIVEPEVNKTGFRCVPVTIKGKVLGYDTIYNSLDRLIEHGSELSSLEFYTEFEKIHPFADGNGRVGAILYNFIDGRLHNPINPPDVFGGDNERR